MSRIWLPKRLLSYSPLVRKNKKIEFPAKKGVQDAYDSIAYMSVDDLAIQNNLDEGRQFSFPSEHCLDRKKIVKELPVELDLFKLENVDLKKIYENLEKLDTDKSVQLKYLKRYVKNYDDLMTNILQEFNGINSKFKMLRRNEASSLPLSPFSFYRNENLFKHSYNVVGFDKSISGLPLYSEKNRCPDESYPKEFIEDLQMFRNKIPIFKRDINFLEYEDNSVNVDPKFLSKGARNQFETNVNKILDIIYENEVPEFALKCENIDEYNFILIMNRKLLESLEGEILHLRELLEKEIKFLLTKNGDRLLLLANQEIKTNQFRLCEVTKPDQIMPGQVVILNHNLKQFNIFPNYSYILNSRRQYKRLFNHFFKLFLINLEDQIDMLIRLKYSKSNEMDAFINHLKSIIETTLNNKFMIPCLVFAKSLAYQNRLTSRCDALFHRTAKSSLFTRIYWLNYKKYPSTSRALPSHNRRGCIRINHKDFSDYTKWGV